MTSFTMKMDVPMSSPRERDVVLAALKPELSVGSRRTKVMVGMSHKGLEVLIHAEDLVAARAAVNSFIRLLDLSISAYRVVRG